MKKDNKTSDNFSNVMEFRHYLTRLEESDRLEGWTDDTPKKTRKQGKRKAAAQTDKENVSKKRHNGGKPCKHCKKTGHPEAKCWELEANASSRPPKWKSVKGEQNESVAILKDDIQKEGNLRGQKKARILKDVTNISSTVNTKTKHKPKLPSENSLNKRKREEPEKSAQVIAADISEMEETMEQLRLETLCPMKAMLSRNSDSKSDNDTSDNEFDGYFPDTPQFLFPFFNRGELNKKAKVGHYTAEIAVEILDRHGKLVPIRALLDTGTTSTILLREFVKKGRAGGYSGQKTLWKTMGGNFTTKKKALVDFRFPELNTDKKVTWVCHVDETTKEEHALYDMIIGMDLMTAIGIYVDTDEKLIRWQGHITPLGRRGLDKEMAQQIYSLTQDATVIQEAEKRQNRILDADYSAVDIDNYVDELKDLTTVEKEQLKFTLHKHPNLFQGGLGVLNVPPVHLQLKPGATPYHAVPYPVPQAVRSTTKVEIDRLEAIGVLKKSSDSEWAAPMFVQPKKTGDVRVLVDFRRLNNMILRKPFPLPKIADLLQTLAGFTYATAIGLSMGYYHIPMDEASKKLCSMVLP